MAAKAGINSSVLSGLITGRRHPNVRYAEALGRVLGVPVEYLLGPGSETECFPAERLRQAIEDLGTELARPNHTLIARKAGVHVSLLSELVNGKRPMTPHYARKLAPVVGVSAGYLLGTEELPGDAA